MVGQLLSNCIPWLLYCSLNFCAGLTCRVSYWLDIPVVSPDALLQLLKGVPSADNHVNHPSGSARQKGTETHVPPALEIGIAESGQLAVHSAPALPAGVESSQDSTLKLALDFASLDTEAMLLRAAAANAAVQLGRISLCETSLLENGAPCSSILL